LPMPDDAPVIRTVSGFTRGSERVMGTELWQAYIEDLKSKT